jgi:hypothetical protein
VLFLLGGKLKQKRKKERKKRYSKIIIPKIKSTWTQTM